jgi:hypothetical protein
MTASGGTTAAGSVYHNLNMIDTRDGSHILARQF